MWSPPAPTTAGVPLAFVNAVMTSWMGLAIVPALFPAKSNPSGRAVSDVTTKDPESPAALKLPPLIMTWFEKVEVKDVAPLQDAL
jgi:hypothetical protein